MGICPLYNVRNLTFNHPENGDWRLVKVQRQVALPSGEVLKKECDYIEEISTGDFYLVVPIEEIREKCFLLLFGAPLYAIGIITVNLFLIGADVTNLAMSILLNFGRMWKDKGGCEIGARLFFALTFEVPSIFANHLWRVAKAPLYAVAFSCACLYGCISPYEGRKWIGKIEKSWHEGMDYRGDFRHAAPSGLSKEEEVEHQCAAFRKGQIIFLAWCMQPRGNRAEKIENLQRFIPINTHFK